MKMFKSAIFLLVVSTLTGCGDNFSCENEEVLKSVNEVIVSNAVNKVDFRTFRPYGQSGLTSHAVKIAWDNPIAIDSNPNVKSLTCKVHLTAMLSDNENNNLKQRIDDINQRAMKEPSYESNKSFIANVNKTAISMAKTRQVTGTVEYTLYQSKGQVVTEVSNTPEVSRVINHIGDNLLRPIARVYAAQRGELSLNNFYSIDILSMFRAR
ncbi:hypothetical protein NVI2019_PEGOAJLN_02506 [Providencia alcalifaciens]|uniref:hypothetical protein n=1 Tax=Providencia alcalifaciens TaxID=126385 RepID=UPI0004512201|nr:hypothetical protein [Providencia alcalifaciens]EUD02956.1 putative lipoprotein [Providencia alcalifaciens RIMD 1656011]CAG9425466.1 hypothetical protein NVI2019_PEGOAJLN_02506 [Providencia alcalifaciens]